MTKTTKSPKKQGAEEDVIDSSARPRLTKLIIRNFRGIGSTPVEIELDQIVVLVGPNNVGKSTILRAYELAMSEGSDRAKLTLDDFPNRVVHPHKLPQIELHTIVHDHAPGAKWIYVDPETSEKLVRERWTWSQENAQPRRQGFNVEINDWAEDGVPWGIANVANSRRPQPHKVDAFADPMDQSKEIVKLLETFLKDRIKSFRSESSDASSLSDYDLLLEQITRVHARILLESETQIKTVQTEVSKMVNEVFPGYSVTFEPRLNEDLDKTIDFFKGADPRLLMGPVDGHQTTIDRQGSGARRTLLWAALRYISEVKGTNALRPHLLLLDEPELCLHPNAIREACRVLYDLPNTNNWQVMVTTHSPAFIDLSRNNTTIVRVDRQDNGVIQGTTVFRPKKVQLDENDRRNLKLLNICDPHVTEFFFGGRSIIVEGDTEYTAFKYVISMYPDEFKDVHIIRARGKAIIVSLVKILNHFGSSYSVLHDCDSPFTKKGKANPMWSINGSIQEAVNAHHERAKVRLLASVPNFEAAYLEEEVDSDKPYNALMEMKNNPEAFEKIKQLLNALIDHDEPLPDGCLEWERLSDLQDALGMPVFEK